MQNINSKQNSFYKLYGCILATVKKWQYFSHYSFILIIQQQWDVGPGSCVIPLAGQETVVCVPA